MRILHVDTGREVRGGQIQMKLTARGLESAGHDCVLLAGERATLSKVWSQSNNVDVVHAHDARAHTLCAVACRRPFVVSRRVAFPVKRTAWSKWKYRRANRYIAVSQFVAQELAAAGVPREKIDVVYDGAHASRAVWNASGRAVGLATADPQKGRTLLERAAHTAGIPVTFSNDLERDLENSSMFVYISQSEGLGSAALLAMAKGIPVIASRVGGLAEVFENGVSGVYVSNDPDEIAAGIRRLREDPDLAATLIQGGLERVNEKFTVEHLIRGTLKSYERALAG
ncbi:MAG TPA: glycosyltransferase family 4 protein [Bryobacteraceae bacterium]|nr:glycosyltransferase family 4 protein [Bryobacteraceae bacterium]